MLSPIHQTRETHETTNWAGGLPRVRGVQPGFFRAVYPAGLDLSRGRFQGFGFAARFGGRHLKRY